LKYSKNKDGKFGGLVMGDTVCRKS